MSTKDLGDLGVAAGDIIDKAFTLGYETGRKYVPVGGMALTAEEGYLAGKVMAALCTRNGYFGDPLGLVDALKFLESALFPATEPAESPRELICPCRGRFGFHDCNTVSTPAEPTEEHRSFPTIQDVPNNTLFHTHGGEGSSLFVRNQSGDLRLCLNAGPEWSKLLQEGDFPPSSGPYVEVPWSKFPQPPADPFAVPAPAEPAEEETKAEGSCTGSGGHHLYPCVLPDGHAGVHVDRRGLRWNSPASSPVVPAPTETGPWQTLAEVPADVARVVDARGRELSRGDHGWKPYYLPQVSAPFVAVREQS